MQCDGSARYAAVPYAVATMLEVVGARWLSWAYLNDHVGTSIVIGCGPCSQPLYLLLHICRIITPQLSGKSLVVPIIDVKSQFGHVFQAFALAQTDNDGHCELPRALW